MTSVRWSSQIPLVQTCENRTRTNSARATSVQSSPRCGKLWPCYYIRHRSLHVAESCLLTLRRFQPTKQARPLPPRANSPHAGVDQMQLSAPQSAEALWLRHFDGVKTTPHVKIHAHRSYVRTSATVRVSWFVLAMPMYKIRRCSSGFSEAGGPSMHTARFDQRQNCAHRGWNFLLSAAPERRATQAQRTRHDRKRKRACRLYVG